MGIGSIPGMTRPWAIATVGMAGFGFLLGYVGSAGAPFCGSLGQCIGRVVDAGPPWFYPASLLPGAITAAIFAGVAYLLCLAVYGLRKAVRGPRDAAGSREGLADLRLPSETPPASMSPEPIAVERPAEPSLVAAGSRRWPMPTPLLIAVGAAVVWAVLSVGPASLADDVTRVFPVDKTSAPVSVCPFNYEIQGSTCVSRAADWLTRPVQEPPKPSLACATSIFEAGPSAQLEPDGWCHQRSGGDLDSLAADIKHGATSGLLAFLAVGAAVLLWPRLRAASAQGGGPRSSGDGS